MLFNLFISAFKIDLHNFNESKHLLTFQGKPSNFHNKKFLLLIKIYLSTNYGFYPSYRKWKNYLQSIFLTYFIIVTSLLLVLMKKYQILVTQLKCKHIPIIETKLWSVRNRKCHIFLNTQNNHMIFVPLWRAFAFELTFQGTYLFFHIPTQGVKAKSCLSFAFTWAIIMIIQLSGYDLRYKIVSINFLVNIGPANC